MTARRSDPPPRRGVRIPALLLASVAAFALLSRVAPARDAVAEPPPVPVDAVLSGAAHAPFDTLLHKYVKGTGVDYNAWDTNDADLGALRRYVAALETVPISQLPDEPAARDAELAYWINLYNAATLHLVLEDYPVDSIKDLGGLLSSPWDRKVVTVEGTELTLNDIENRVIRARFDDEPRIHFALNCASKSCPPLRAEAYTGARLDEQLEEQTRAFLSDPGHSRVEGDHYRLSKIFDWYKDDFVKAAGSVPAFVRPYVPRAETLREDAKVKHLDYDWALNEAD